MFEVIQKYVQLNQERPHLHITLNWLKSVGNIKFCCFRLDMNDLFQNKCYTLAELEQYFLKQNDLDELTLDNIDSKVQICRGKRPQDVVCSEVQLPNGMRTYGFSYSIVLTEAFIDSVAVVYIYDNEHIEKLIVSLWENQEIGFHLTQEKEKRGIWKFLSPQKTCYRLELTQNNNRIKIMRYTKDNQEYRMILPPSARGVYYLPYDLDLVPEHIKISYLMFNV